MYGWIHNIYIYIWVDIGIVFHFAKHFAHHEQRPPKHYTVFDRYMLLDLRWRKEQQQQQRSGAYKFINLGVFMRICVCILVVYCVHSRFVAGQQHMEQCGPLCVCCMLL